MAVNDNDKIPTDTDACYEILASQEEIALEEAEEEVYEVLESDAASPLQSNDACVTESLDEQLKDAAEDLITGDADDPPLSEEAVGEMLSRTRRSEAA